MTNQEIHDAAYLAFVDALTAAANGELDDFLDRIGAIAVEVRAERERRELNPANALDGTGR